MLPTNTVMACNPVILPINIGGNMDFRILIAAMMVSVTIFSCIPARQVEELQGKYDSCETERRALSAEKRDLETKTTELTAEIEKMSKDLIALARDTTLMGTSMRKISRQFDKSNRLNDELLRKMSILQKGSEEENKKLLEQLTEMQNDLQRREDDLKDAEKELASRREALETLKADLEQAGKEIENAKLEIKKREQRVNELESIIAQKDAAAKALKDKITQALLGFKDKGLSVEQRDGKIYVSLEAKLLFAKGSTKVDVEGKKALTELAKVLQDQEDLEILVEGHTDTDKLSGTGIIKDNWDLSVMRATSVVKIMLTNSTVDPVKITAAGRGHHFPVDPADTEEAKAKNRRIEVILTPNLDKLFEIIESE